MINEYTYCPRLCYIEWIQKEFEDNYYTVDGRYQHRRVDQPKGQMDESESRAVMMSAPELGIIGRMDMIIQDGEEAIPVEYKRGRVPSVPEGAHEPERVQLCALGLILRENGRRCERGQIYFVESKAKADVTFDENLIQRTKQAIEGVRKMASSGEIPHPLENSPKCDGCSLVGICLPDELNLLRGEADRVRNFYPGKDDVVPVYLVSHDVTAGKKGECLELRKAGGEREEVPFREIGHVSIFGNARLTSQAQRELMQRGITICHFSRGGWFYGYTQGNVHKNVELRVEQFRTAAEHEGSMRLARKFVMGKIKNCRTMLRRNDEGVSKKTLDELRALLTKASRSLSPEELLGIEGMAAKIYFDRFDCLLRMEGISFDERNKRPPMDPVNAVMSYLSALLTKECFVNLLCMGFDPYLGFYHRPRYGKPALALDLMEEFRPLIIDSTVLRAFNSGEVGPEGFLHSGGGVQMKDGTKKRIISAYERRLDTEIKHPIFGYTVSYRRIIEVQSRLLMRAVMGEIPTYPPFCTR
jgi:CRISPR-associated protein Cas1